MLKLFIRRTGVLFLLVFVSCGVRVSHSGHAKRTAYPALHWSGNEPQVRHNGRWCELLAIDEHETGDIIATAKRHFGSQWKKRFAEDLYRMVLPRMNVRVGDSVDLTLRDLDTGSVRVFKEVPLSRENRSALMEYDQLPPGVAEDESAWLATPVASSPAGEYPKLSPFEGLRWSGADPEVYLDGTWYRPVSISGVDVESLLAFCRAEEGGKWQKRFGEDLVEMLSRMGHEVGGEVDLVLAPLAAGHKGERIELEGVAMTLAKRQAIRKGKLHRVDRVEREHRAGSSLTDEYALLKSKVSVDPVGQSGKLTREQVWQDLDQLEWLIENVYSYRDLTGVDYRLALDTIRHDSRDGLSRSDFGLAVTRFLGLFGDGHARLALPLKVFLPRGYTPFLVGETQEGLVAFKADRSGFVEPKNMILQQLDGVPIGRWIDAAKTLQSSGSHSLVRSTALRNLRFGTWLRGELGIDGTDVLVGYVTSAGRRSGFHGDFPMVNQLPSYGMWPRSKTHLIDDEIGYLRIEKMRSSDEFADSLHAAMKEFRGTKGLIIDVRGNGGGSRRALKELFGYFMVEGETSRVANVAAYRLRPGEERLAKEGHLSNRFLHPLGSNRWGAEERRDLRIFLQGFAPSWNPDPVLFSAWHFFTLRHEPSRHSYTYDKPVVVLMDTGCFSATDIFLGAFKGWSRVTLIGRPSGGGSGRVRSYTLAHSGFTAKLSSMASFQPTGEAYDGVGIQPDIEVYQQAENYIGVGDAQLTEALVRLRR